MSVGYKKQPELNQYKLEEFRSRRNWISLRHLIILGDLVGKHGSVWNICGHFWKCLGTFWSILGTFWKLLGNVYFFLKIVGNDWTHFDDVCCFPMFLDLFGFLLEHSETLETHENNKKTVFSYFSKA